MSAKESLRVCLISLGCPKNLVDSEKMLAALAEGGCLVPAPMDESDVIIINTCGFLSAAREESLEVIREAIEHKRAGRVQRIVVAGCLVNRDADKLFGMVDGIDALVPVDDRDEILAAVTGRQAGRIAKAMPGIVSDAGRFRLTSRHTAYLRIAEGCSQKCRFCTIPAIRGPFRSKPPEMVLAEARELLDDGLIELNIIAQDTTAYGSDMGFDITLAGLLRQLDALDGATWIRLMYTYPRRFTDELIATIAECEHVVPYVDMPLQHVSDDVLRRMGRGVKRADIEARLDKLRSRVPEIALRTTFITGFPGETEAEFEELLAFIKNYHFEAMGVFAFSPEEGTPAADMDNQVPDAVKNERAEALMLAQQEIAFAANAEKIGRKLDVLIDGIDGNGYCIGRSTAQAPEIDSVCYLAEPQEPGQIIRTDIIDYDGYDLIVNG